MPSQKKPITHGHGSGTANDTLSTAPLFFHHEDRKYGEFSQWYRSSFVVSKLQISALVGQPVSSFSSPGDYTDDIPFVTAEQFMMYCKAACFRDRSIAEQILHTEDPRGQKSLGRLVADFDPVKWDAVKSSVVAAASLAKFGQNEDLRALLLGTGRRELIEAAPNDRIWGIGFSEKDARNMRSRREWGENLLGRALVVARETLRNEDKRHLAQSKYHQVIVEGTVGQLRARQEECALCRILLQALSHEYQDRPDALMADQAWEAEWYQNIIEYDPIADGAEDQYGSALCPRLKGDPTSVYGVQLVDGQSTQHLVRGRVIPARMDVATIMSWLARCSREHGDDCLQTYLSIPEHPSNLPGFMVIDVEKLCLAQLPEGVAYTTLSYVWGTTNSPTTLKTNVDAFREPGAFRRTRLPKTISDAIEVTSALGFRFLWVDALCIVQDDDDFKTKLIANMDAVYGNSALTIVAASGDHADAGLEGWRQAMEAGSRQSTVKIEDGFILGVLPFFDLELMNSTFASRGWTYQETALSARRLIFLGGQFYFVCRGAVWREDVMAESNLIQPFTGANTLGTGASEWTLGRYSEHVAAYSSRKLTYSSDAINAFTGIQKALQGSMGNTRFWYGLPAAALDWALLWKPTTGTKLARREQFPSWSWAGWDGSVTHPPSHPSNDDQKWLTDRTWIDWYIVNDERAILRAWEPLNESLSRNSQLSGSPNPSSQPKLEDENERPCANSERESSDDEDLEDFMPTYGMSLGHPFTRRMSTRYSPVDTGQSNIPGSGNEDKLSPGTLVFETQVHIIGDTIKLSLASTSDAADDFEYQIIDKETEKVCGLVWTKDVLPQPVSGMGDWFGLLALSFAAPSTLDREALEKGGVDETYLQTAAQETSVDGERIFGEWHEWDFFNIMLVHGQGHTGHKILHAERRGLGLMHRDILMDESSNLDSKVIALT
ncbi:unnamed protein product [Clonostachys rosea]|uniref:Heterokaryon incompatibility domain-containing protein n=1 Tax=Bionectria ochroleuca TaxID=29856 RepID=A0ABY6UIV0_BIOOC|nr:unnamed protein product [Clonostachys rosea]